MRQETRIQPWLFYKQNTINIPIINSMLNYWHPGYIEFDGLPSQKFKNPTK